MRFLRRVLTPPNIAKFKLIRDIVELMPEPYSEVARQIGNQADREFEEWRSGDDNTWCHYLETCLDYGVAYASLMMYRVMITSIIPEKDGEFRDACIRFHYLINRLHVWLNLATASLMDEEFEQFERMTGSKYADVALDADEVNQILDKVSLRMEQLRGR